MDKETLLIMKRLDVYAPILISPWDEVAKYLIDKYDTGNILDEYELDVASSIVMMVLMGRKITMEVS